MVPAQAGDMQVSTAGTKGLALSTLARPDESRADCSMFQSAPATHSSPCCAACSCNLPMMRVFSPFRPAPHTKYKEYTTIGPIPGTVTRAQTALPSTRLAGSTSEGLVAPRKSRTRMATPP